MRENRRRGRRAAKGKGPRSRVANKGSKRFKYHLALLRRLGRAGILNQMRFKNELVPTRPRASTWSNRQVVVCLPWTSLETTKPLKNRDRLISDQGP